jgi:hypothetical protein
MHEIAENRPASKRLPAAPRVFDAELSSRLNDLPPHAHARVGALLDAKRIQLLLDDDGRAIVARGAVR